jgi:predicted TIM-barrel fold metal-dependent hydrolase
MSTPRLVVDADGHVLEPPDGMVQHAPARFRDRIWRIERKADGSEWLHFNGGTRPAGGMALAGTAGMSAADRERARAGKMRYTEVRPGAFEPGPRLPDMDVEGITQAVLYPTMLLGLPGFEDAEFAEAQANAYNDWLADYCAYAPRRLFGAAVVPTQDTVGSSTIRSTIRSGPRVRKSTYRSGSTRSSPPTCRVPAGRSATRRSGPRA